MQQVTRSAACKDATPFFGSRPLKLHRGETFGEVSLDRAGRAKGGKPALPRVGTGSAITNLPNGGAADSASRSGSGGARNRADRESHALTAAHIANLLEAQAHATAVGLPFTRMTTIHWGAAEIPLAEMAQATGRFVDLLSKALGRHGSQTAWLWVHENCGPKGGHCHLLAHVPANLVPRVASLQRGWLRRITGQPYRAGVIYSKPIGARLGLETSNPELHAANLAVAFGYLCKGAPQEILDAAGIDREHQPGGRVIGKRCGTSQNIGAKARRLAELAANSARARDIKQGNYNGEDEGRREGHTAEQCPQGRSAPR